MVGDDFAHKIVLQSGCQFAFAPCTEPMTIVVPRESEVVHADARTYLAQLPDDFFQVCVTSPPYWGLRDYDVSEQIGAEERLDDYVANLVRVFGQVRRVLHPDGTLWLNLGDAYTSGGRDWRAPDKKLPQRHMTYRPDTPEGLKPKDLIGIPWRVAFALQDDGWYLRSEIIWEKPNSMPESVKDRPARCHEHLFLLTKSEKYYYDHEAVREPRDDGKGVRNRRTVWSINTESFTGAHFATFPTALVEPCLLAGSRRGDFVIDPFFGAGTVGVVAKRLGRRYFGIEIKQEYVELATARIDAVQLAMEAVVRPS